MLEVPRLSDLAQALSLDSLHESIQSLLRILVKVTGADVAEIFLAQPNENGMVLTWLEGPFKRAFSQIFRFERGEGFPGIVLESKKPYFSNNLKEDRGYLRSKVKSLGFESYLCLPLLAMDKVVGSVHLAFRCPGDSLQSATAILSMIAPLLSVRLQAGLFHLQEAVTLPNKDPHSFLQEVLRRAVHLSSAQGGNLYLVRTGKKGGVVEAAGYGFASGLECPSLQKESCGICPAVSNCQSVLLSRSENHWPKQCKFDPHQESLAYCIPMKIQPELKGLLQLAYRSNPPLPPSQNLVLLEWASEKMASRISEFLKKEEIHLFSHAGGEEGEESLPAKEREAYLNIRCFGPLRLHLENKLVTAGMVRRKKALTLLKILLTFDERVFSKYELVELLWPEVKPRNGENHLHVTIHALRKLIEPRDQKGKWTFLQNEGSRYWLSTEKQCYVDVEDFGTSLREAKKIEQKGNLPEAASLYEKALRLYRGDFLADEPFAEWCWIRREELRQNCMDAARRLALIYEKQGRWDLGIPPLRQALQIDLYREELHRELMRCLWRSGRRDEALRQYEICKEKLGQELNISPLSETTELADRIRTSRDI